jgi:hypothetical protein
VRDPHTVEVKVSADYGGSACTTDMGPTTSVLELPATVDRAGALTVRVRFDRGSSVEVQASRVDG